MTARLSELDPIHLQSRAAECPLTTNRRVESHSLPRRCRDWCMLICAVVGLISVAMVGRAHGTDAPMVFIPAGPFIMGATREQQQIVLRYGWPPDWHARIARLVKSAGPQRRVYLDSFHLDKHEVTNRQFEEFVQATDHRPPTFWSSHPQLSEPGLPVVGVSWHDADAYCSWAGKRLPTEAEWEKAARGVDGHIYPWGNNWDRNKLRSAEHIAGRPLEDFSSWFAWQRIATTDPVLARPTAVGTHHQGVSPFGVMDMAGNVWEWVADWYGPDYYARSPSRNPRGPAGGELKVLRGGGWDVPRVVANTWFRENVFPPSFDQAPVTGFRCAKGGARSDSKLARNSPDSPRH